jgi:gliding motility-associated-like protein
MAGLLRNSYNKAVWLLCHTAFFLGLMPAIAQHNLVPNGGFEILDTCPKTFGQIHHAKPWVGIGTPDLFNSCSSTNGGLGVPKNLFGFQNPKSGNGYAGFGSGSIGFNNALNLPPETDYYEYLQIRLDQELVFGQKYCYQYFVSTANPGVYYNNNYTIYLLKEFSIVLSGAPISNSWDPITKQCYIDFPATHTFNTGFTTDTAAWYEVRGEFIANGGEKYLTIGIFKLLTTNDILLVSSKTDFAGAYYYIDDVSLYYCGPDTVPKPTELQLPEIPNVFTPNGDGYNDEFRFIHHEGWELNTIIRNRWGQVVFEGKNDHWWDGTIQGQHASPGVYYYTVTARNHFGQHEAFLGVVTLLR